MPIRTIPELTKKPLVIRERRRSGSGGDDHSGSLTHELATIDAGGDLLVTAGGDLTVRGARRDRRGWRRCDAVRGGRHDHRVGAGPAVE